MASRQLQVHEPLSQNLGALVAADGEELRRPSRFELLTARQLRVCLALQTHGFHVAVGELSGTSKLQGSVQAFNRGSSRRRTSERAVHAQCPRKAAMPSCLRGERNGRTLFLRRPHEVRNVGALGRRYRLPPRPKSGNSSFCRMTRLAASGVALFPAASER